MLRAVELVKQFGGVKAVDGVTLEMEHGDRLGLIGPNGSGKTTTFNVISGFMKPDGGRVLFHDRDISRYGLDKTASVGLVRTFQHDACFPGLTVRENLELPLLARKRGGRKRPDRLAKERLLAESGLADRADELACDLSYGHRRLLGVAIAASLEPSLLMLDEPAAGLNVDERERLARVLLDLNAQGISLLVIEHDMEFIERVCQRVIVLNAGRNLAEGAPAAVRNDRRVADAYLGPAVAAPESRGD
jgi:ABC-type branched-subunit amino acid transport system ATPase component